MIINQHFYDANAQRLYPLCDSASAVDSTGAFLPSNLIVDLNLRYPESLGYYPFIAAVTVTATLVTVTLQCANAFDATTQHQPLAAISMPVSSLQAGRQFAIAAQTPGVGGWIVFGKGIFDGGYVGRFTGPGMTLLSPRAARSYKPLPVLSVAKLYSATELTGIMHLLAESPLEIVASQLEIAGVLRNVAVIQLTQPASAAAGTTATADNVFSQYIGPCGARPESGNCGTWTPIQYLNTVQPDCNGVITVEFNGCASISKLTDGSGITLDCNLGLSSACLPAGIPDANGKLPNDYGNLCTSESAYSDVYTSDNYIPFAAYTPGPGGDSIVSESLHATGLLPFVDHFDLSADPHFTVWTGSFKQVAFDAPDDVGATVVASYSTETAQGKSQLNIALWNGFDHSTVNRQYKTAIYLLPGSLQSNAGLVLNWKQGTGNKYAYFLVKLDYSGQAFGIWQVTGNAPVATSAVTTLTNIQQNVWYDIQATVTPAAGSNVSIVVTLTALSGPALTVTLSLTTNKYLPANGMTGLCANNSLARFAYFDVKEV